MATAKYYLALIRLDRGHTLQAQRLLAEANQAAAALQPSLALYPLNWSRPIQLETLRQEVEGRLPPTTKPAAPATRSK